MFLTRNIIEAAYDCQQSGNGRLLAIRNCDELSQFRKELFLEGHDPGHFFVGLFTNIFMENSTKHRSTDKDTIISS